MENEIIVDAITDVEVVAQPSIDSDSTSDEQVSENSEKNEVADVQAEEKPKQSQEENAKFAEVRRKAAQEAEDKVYANLYQKEYGIKSKADYEAYMAEVEQAELIDSLKDEDIDPREVLEKYKQTDPEYRELQQYKNDNYIKTQIQELNNDLKELGIDTTITTLDDLTKLNSVEKMTELLKAGRTLSEAYFLANRKDIVMKQTELAQQKAINKIAANGNSTPGSLSDNGVTAQLFTKEQVDNMSMDEINKNYELVMKSVKTWK